MSAVTLTGAQVDALAREWSIRPDRTVRVGRVGVRGVVEVRSCDDRGPFVYTLAPDGGESRFRRLPGRCLCPGGHE